MREKLISLVIVGVFFTFLFLAVSTFTGNVSYEGLDKLSDEYKDVKKQEVYSCHDRTTYGAGQVSILVNKGHLRTVFVTDFCATNTTLRMFACQFEKEKGKHYLISADVACAADEECSRDQCRASRLWRR